MSKHKLIGKEIAKAFETLNINAMWVAGKGMIFMSAFYGATVSVAGTYNLYTLETAADVLEKVTAARASGDEDTVESWLLGRETGRKHQVL